MPKEQGQFFSDHKENMQEEVGRIYDEELYWNTMLLKLSGIWPKDRSWGRSKYILYETYAIIQMTGLIVITALEYFSIRDAWGSVYEGLHFMRNREILKEIYFSMRKMWISTSVESAVGDSRKILWKTARICKYILMLYAIAPTITTICFSLSPLKFLIEQRGTNISEKDINYTFPYGAQFPWINMSDSLNYSLCYLGTCGVSVAVILYEMGVDSFYMLHISQICEQFKLLDSELREVVSFYKNVNGKSRLCYCIEKHLKLIRMCELMNKLYSPIILIFSAFTTISLCTVIFQIALMDTKSNPVLYTSYLIFECSEIFMFCWFGQQMTDQSHLGCCLS